MAGPVIFQELLFSPDNHSQHSYAYFPPSMRGQYQEFTVYIQTSTGVSTGAVQLETSFPDPTNGAFAVFAGTWGNVGSAISTTGASTQYYASVAGNFADLRLDISTAIGATGSIRAFVTAAPQSA